jgi:hypothetical protein
MFAVCDKFGCLPTATQVAIVIGVTIVVAIVIWALLRD